MILIGVILSAGTTDVDFIHELIDNEDVKRIKLREIPGWLTIIGFEIYLQRESSFPAQSAKRRQHIIALMQDNYFTCVEERSVVCSMPAAASSSAKCVPTKEVTFKRT